MDSIDLPFLSDEGQELFRNLLRGAVTSTEARDLILGDGARYTPADTLWLRRAIALMEGKESEFYLVLLQMLKADNEMVRQLAEAEMRAHRSAPLIRTLISSTPEIQAARDNLARVIQCLDESGGLPNDFISFWLTLAQSSLSILESIAAKPHERSPELRTVLRRLSDDLSNADKFIELAEILLAEQA